VMYENRDSFHERLANIVNSDALSVRAGIQVSPEQVSDAVEQLTLKLQHGRIRASDVSKLCSEIAAKLDNRAGSCRGRQMFDVLKNIVDKNWDMLVKS